jgi:hypothetical protein
MLVAPTHVRHLRAILSAHDLGQAMSKPPFLFLPLVVSVAIAAHAQRIPGNAACLWADHIEHDWISPEHIPIQFNRASDSREKNFESLKLTRIEPPPEFRRVDLRSLTTNSTNKWRLNLGFTLPNGCGYRAAERHITIPNSVMQRLHEQTMQNAKQNAGRSASE